MSPTRVAAALAILGAALCSASPAPGAAPVRSVSERAWMRLLAEYARSAGDATRGGDDAGGWFPRPVPLTLPHGGGGAVPMLVVPVPVPTRDASLCEAGAPRLTVSVRRDHPPPPPPPAGAVRSPTPAPAPLDESPAVPHLDYVVSSQQLVELFRAQVAPNPELPPAVIPDYPLVEEGVDEALPTAPYPRLVRVRRRFLAGSERRVRAALPLAEARGPLAPRFDRSLMLRGELTVPRAGYSEPYTVWWDAASGAARTDFHGGASSAYRHMLSDGRVQHLEVRTDRSGERIVRRCAVSAPRRASAADRAVPAFPDMQAFSFAGYVESEYGVVERWTQTVSGGSGELGGARGEALTFRHEMLVARAPDNYTTTPLRYAVSVDSSVLGPECDGHVHRYTELRDQHQEPHVLRLDLDESCEEVVQTEARERVDPLREFVMATRDRRYDLLHAHFRDTHRRRYMDDTEEAVRKNLMMQHVRFVNSGNRQGATFGMELNHLGDRLDAELGVLMGVSEEAEALPAEQFPHSRDDVSAQRARLPRRFDWRPLGAVSHVRNQGSCSSCWAIAVTGAVEGALFVATRRLVPLSEQCLVDCAHPYGGHGCGGTWPSSAYDYVRDRGLPALDDYTAYQGKVLQCEDKRVPPVTHISAHVNVTKNDVQALKVAIRRHAPSVVIIDATPKSFIFYKSGVVRDERCAKNSAQHAVLAVGWGEQRGAAHFILKNSWSEKWGDGGYVRVSAPDNTCGVLSRPSYARLAPPDVDRVPAAARDN